MCPGDAPGGWHRVGTVPSSEEMLLIASSPLAVIVCFSLYVWSLLFFFLAFVLHLVGLSRQGLDGTETTRTYLEEGNCFVLLKLLGFAVRF